MKDHYKFSDSQIENLHKIGVMSTDLFKAIKLFDPHNSGEPISFVNLLLYIDEKGNFNDPPKNSHKKIAKQVYENLTRKEKLSVMQYLDDYEEDFKND